MTDVVKIAKEHLDALEAQISKLEEFIRMADALLKHRLSNADKAADTAADIDDEKPADPTDSTKARPFFSGTDENDAGAKREDFPVRKLKAGERVPKPDTLQDEPVPERRFPSLGRLHP